MYERPDLDIILESHVTTYYENIKYKSLNEAEKMQFADQLVTKLFKDIKKKTLQIDDKEIGKTKGDFTKHSSYKTIGKALRFLEESANQQNHTELHNRVKVLKETHQLLAANKDIFKDAFNNGNDVVILSYCNICVGLIVGTSEAISLNMQMVQSKKMGANSVGDRSFGGKSNYIDGLKKANEVMKTNKLRMIHSKIVVKNEAFIDDVKKIGSGTYNFLTDRDPKKVGITAVLGGIIFVLAFAKTICFTYFRSRIKLADHARNTAEYVQLKSEGLTDNNIKAKQQKWIDRLLAFAEKVDIDSKNANSKANDDIKASDQEYAEMPTTWIM